MFLTFFLKKFKIYVSYLVKIAYKLILIVFNN